MTQNIESSPSTPATCPVSTVPHREIVFKCCNLNFNKKDEFHKHIKNHVNPKQKRTLKKTKTPLEESIPRMTLRPRREKMNLPPNKIPFVSGGEKYYVCKCKYNKALSLARLLLHKNQSHRNRVYGCNYCTKTSKNIRRIFAHIHIDHPNDDGMTSAAEGHAVQNEPCSVEPLSSLEKGAAMEPELAAKENGAPRRSKRQRTPSLKCLEKVALKKPRSF